MNKKILWITQTAMSIALLLVVQVVFSKINNQILTGAAVNLLLITFTMVFGLATGVSVAIVSPILAFMLGIPKFLVLVPFIMLGNVVLILLWHFIGNRKIINSYVSYGIALVVAAAAKFLVLYVTIVKIIVPASETLPAPIASMFSFPQLITALIGGALAVLVFPILKTALRRENR